MIKSKNLLFNVWKRITAAQVTGQLFEFTEHSVQSRFREIHMGFDMFKQKDLSTRWTVKDSLHWGSLEITLTGPLIDSYIKVQIIPIKGSIDQLN